MANDFSGRIWKINTFPATTTNGAQNVKIKGGSWTGTQGATANQFTITDGGGRTYTWTWSASGQQVTFGELGWLEGPVTFNASGTAPFGEVDLYLGTK
jgi:hypothetical protein